MVLSVMEIVLFEVIQIQQLKMKSSMSMQLHLSFIKLLSQSLQQLVIRVLILLFLMLKSTSVMCNVHQSSLKMQSNCWVYRSNAVQRT